MSGFTKVEQGQKQCEHGRWCLGEAILIVQPNSQQHQSEELIRLTINEDQHKHPETVPEIVAKQFVGQHVSVHHSVVPARASGQQFTNRSTHISGEEERVARKGETRMRSSFDSATVILKQLE